VTVSNYAGHAAPTGEPMKQYLVLVSALDGAGAPVDAAGGQAVADVGGALAAGALGAGVTLDGLALTFEGAIPAGATSARFARPTGGWVDYPGPGTAHFSSGALSAEEKGVEALEYLGEVAIAGADGVGVTLAAAPPALEAGDRVYLGGGDRYAGAPGWAYGKVMVDAEGARGVAHYRAVHVASDDRIAPGGDGVSLHRFPAPASGESLVVTATLLRRERALPVSSRYGWDPGDHEVASTTEEHPAP